MSAVNGPSGVRQPSDSDTLHERQVPRPSTRATPNLRRLRTDQALTQEQLAQKASVARSIIAGLETGREARMPTIARLATALGVEPTELTREKPNA